MEAMQSWCQLEEAVCAKKSMEKMWNFQVSVKSSLCYCESFYTEFLHSFYIRERQGWSSYNHPVDSGLYSESYGEPLEDFEQRLS